jgi:hypothetical protein
MRHRRSRRFAHQEAGKAGRRQSVTRLKPNEPTPRPELPGFRSLSDATIPSESSFAHKIETGDDRAFPPLVMFGADRTSVTEANLTGFPFQESLSMMEKRLYRGAVLPAWKLTCSLMPGREITRSRRISIIYSKFCKERIRHAIVILAFLIP